MSTKQNKFNSSPLHSNASFHRSIVETSLDGFCLLNADGVITEVNSAFCQLSAYSENEVIGMNISELNVGESDKGISSHLPVRDTLEEQHLFFKNQAHEKGLELKLSVTDLQLNTDKYKFEGILINLIKNALKFTDSGYIEFGNYQKDNKAYFYVKDTGRGIPKEKVNAIFDRFVQADMEITRAHEGSGLGLSIVKAYLHLLGGNIELRSEENKGSTFTFSLPI